jgi:hypothetical protein
MCRMKWMLSFALLLASVLAGSIVDGRAQYVTVY